MQNNAEMFDFVKALAHADRLKIIGLLTQKPASLVEIVEGGSLPARQVFNHLAFLEYVGVVSKRNDLYELDKDGLERLAHRQLEGNKNHYTPALGLKKDHHKTLETFLNADGSIRQLPNSRTQAAKFRVILEYLLASFETGVVYTEKEVNGILNRYNEDVSGLRRDLINAGMLKRERDGSKYWRPE